MAVQHKNLYVDAITVVGASKGKDATWIHFDVDLSTPQTHAYPIPEREIPRGASCTSADDLQGYVEL